MSDENKTEDLDKSEGILYIGIDLGTSRTSVAASNGVRETVWSYVGYPKDHVARKVLGKDRLFGREAVEQRLSLELIRPFQDGALKHGDIDDSTLEKHMQAAKDLVKYAISLCKPRKDELLYGVIGAPAQASIRNQQLLLEAASEVLDAAMICSEPFAVAYGLDLLRDTLVVDIGAGTVDLCRLHGTMPAADDQITLTTAGDWIDKQLYSLIREKAPDADYTIHFVKEAKEKYAYVTDEGNPIEVDLLVNGKPTRFDLTDTMREGCRMAVPPIVESLHKLVSTFDPDFQRKLRENVLFAGGGSQIHGLDVVLEKAMREMLGSGKVTRVEEPQYAGANGALKMAHDTPEEYWKRLE
jgi:rod shape-determining protein MreB